MAKAGRYPYRTRYRYTVKNERTGLELTRVIFAINDENAREQVYRIRDCFGRGTKIVKLSRLRTE